MRDDLNPQQVDALHALGWRSPAERAAIARRKFWRKVAIVSLCVAVAVVVLRLVNNPDSYVAPGWDCTTDCSGQRAGYEWARDHNITDPARCNSASPSFREGCLTWAEPAAYPDGY